MPRPDQLPVSLAGLARHQAIEISHARFGSDISQLLAVLDKALVPARTRRRPEEPLPGRTRPARAAPPAPMTAWGPLPATVIAFQDDDDGFRCWREDNPGGFFLNA